MKKKLAISLLTGAILLGGAGTFAYAQTGGFEEMKPYMEKAHPELSNQELEQMYNACHEEGGMMDQYEDSANR
ncbi:hypothetical protein LI012_10265 [Caldibacillus thermoamylovorans]|jgi:hypothetical protein|uniref:hypothetical protein n=1 Tax=Bacillaceae TaxID=186817 RepID=UPI001D09596E|nr:MULTISPECIES: hypothetical protein [Bacillaceae]MCB5936316.1 hypothetical protein [Bacillus sp. DFI.2.34]MCB7070291.1 hypothetical protein [Caldibacillus sp. 210928-DFI.2.22]MCB7073749.1 hypothetical protein [Caldibacillus sp. 210928-DFI.2.18]MCB7077199.1 hypothetical protein [Caldibacillus thermoamylovorans]MCM3800160.1 hypothetical protein [Caldibacillus thermoamylovorans]